MPDTKPDQTTEIECNDGRWKDLYRLGGISLIVNVALLVFAIAAFFIWGYKPGSTSTLDVFTVLQKDRLGGLFSLDIFVLIIPLLGILPTLAWYVALKRVNESYALIALVLGLMSVAAVIPSRPILEIVSLSEKFAAASSEAAKSQLLAAGETFLAVFSGTGWMVWTILGNISYLIYSLLMLYSDKFNKTLAWMGIILSVAGMAIFIPVIGVPTVLVATILSPVWDILVARAFFRLGRSKPV